MRSALLLTIAMVATVVTVVALTKPAPSAGEHSYVGIISDMSNDIGAPDTAEYAIEVIGTFDLPTNDRGPWCISVEPKEFGQAHTGQRVEFKFLNTLHTAIDIVKYYH